MNKIYVIGLLSCVSSALCAPWDYNKVLDPQAKKAFEVLEQAKKVFMSKGDLVENTISAQEKTKWDNAVTGIQKYVTTTLAKKQSGPIQKISDPNRKVIQNASALLKKSSDEFFKMRQKVYEAFLKNKANKKSFARDTSERRDLSAMVNKLYQGKDALLQQIFNMRTALEKKIADTSKDSQSAKALLDKSFEVIIELYNKFASNWAMFMA